MTVVTDDCSEWKGFQCNDCEWGELFTLVQKVQITQRQIKEPKV